MNDLSRKRTGTWVLSACALSRVGIAALLTESGCAPGEVVLLSGREYRSDVQETLRQVPPARILILPPPSLSDLLIQIKQLSWLMDVRSSPSVLLLGGTEEVWIFDTVSKLAGSRARRNRVWFLSVRTPISRLRTALNRWKWDRYAGPDALPLRNTGKACLSPRELQSLQMTLDGITVRAQSCLTGLSSKTLYSHRSRALRKLQPEGNRRGAYRLWKLFLLSDMNGVNYGDV